MDQTLTSEAGYDDDFYVWTQRQTGLLRPGRFDALNVDHLVDELETFGRSGKPNNPSLRAKPASFLDTAYDKGRREASIQTGARESFFPAECPYTLVQITSDTFVPSDGSNETDDFLPDDTAPPSAKD